MAYLVFVLVTCLELEARANEEPESPAENLGAVGAKLSNPVADVWALFTEFDVTFNNGNLNRGDDQVGSLMNFQPAMPIPVYGDGEDRWKVILRPSVPLLFASPRPDPGPTGRSDTNYDAGLSDILFPLVLTPPSRMSGQNLIVGVGPTFVLPTSTKEELGRRQWQAGVAAGIGYKNEKVVLGMFPQYFWGIGGRGDQGSAIDDASNMALLYWAFLNLPDAWQVGMNPTITYDHKASSGNKWNVPIGLVAAKTTRLGGMPVKFQAGFEYSVVSQDDFGRRALFKVNVIPVIPSLISRPLLGGGG